jgi:hypothetical protein
MTTSSRIEYSLKAGHGILHVRVATQDEMDRYMTPALDWLSEWRPKMFDDGIYRSGRYADKLICATVIMLVERQT